MVSGRCQGGGRQCRSLRFLHHGTARNWTRRAGSKEGGDVPHLDVQASCVYWDHRGVALWHVRWHVRCTVTAETYVRSKTATYALLPACRLNWFSYSGRKKLRTSFIVTSRLVGGRGRPQGDSTWGERTQSFPCIIRCENTSRLQKYRNGGHLWVVNVFSYTIHAQTLGHRAPPCPFNFSPLTVTFPKRSVILRPLYWSL
jgi:hypothetical protein